MQAIAGTVYAKIAHFGGAAGLTRPIDSPKPATPVNAKLLKAAGEFESILLESLWKSMKDTFADQGDKDADPTLESFDDWGMQAMARAVGNSGALGIKNMIIKHLAPKAPTAGSGPSGRNQIGGF